MVSCGKENSTRQTEPRRRSIRTHFKFEGSLPKGFGLRRGTWGVGSRQKGLPADLGAETPCICPVALQPSYIGKFKIGFYMTVVATGMIRIYIGTYTDDGSEGNIPLPYGRSDRRVK